MHDINERYGVNMPILNGVYDILYRGVSASRALVKMAPLFS